MLPKRRRLTRSEDYVRVRRTGRSRAHPLLILAATPNGGEETRVGFTVGKSVGTAVARNRAKRLLREAARSRLPCIRRGYDLVLTGRRETATARLDDVCAALDLLLRRAGILANNGDGGP